LVDEFEFIFEILEVKVLLLGEENEYEVELILG
jgi:hypothetical protein